MTQVKLSEPEKDFLYALADYVDLYGDEFAITTCPEQNKLGNRLLRKGLVMRGKLKDGRTAFRLLNGGYNLASELWETELRRTATPQEQAGGGE